MSREALALWANAATELELVRTSLPAPVHVLGAEAVDLARFCRDYWQPVAEGMQARPGLSEAREQLSEDIVSDLLVLQEALYTAHTDYLLTIPPIHSGMRSRAENVLSELMAVVEWVLDDGRHDASDEELCRLRDEHAPLSNTVNNLGVQLGDYAVLASKLRAQLARVNGFRMSLIDDAHHLARELQQLSYQATLSVETLRALDLRNRMATLLVNHMSHVRSVATNVFRDHPSIANLAVSTFELRQRATSQQQLNGLASQFDWANPTA
jgi:hypothetical protein